MRITRLLLLAAVLFGSARALRAQASASPAEAQVRAVVERYLHGLKFNNIQDFEAAFWPDAKLLFVKKDGSLGQLTQQEWYKMFAGSAGKEEEGTLKILAIDVTDNAASVKVIETYAKSVYVDYLNMLQIAGEWRIVNKIYTSRPTH